MADYEKFVICLLEDDTGDKMKIIKKDKSTVVNVLNEVFIQWIKGKGLQPVLLQTFISCLEKADYHELIKDMKWSEKDFNRKNELYVVPILLVTLAANVIALWECHFSQCACSK